MNDYQRCIAFWDSVFSEENDSVPLAATSGNVAIDKAIHWVSNKSERVFDFGCGNGIMLFYCAQNGTKFHFGIDLSEQAIITARNKAANMPCGVFEFQQGGVDALNRITDASFDAGILSNVIDNLYPEDAALLLHACARILKENGKLLVKLNQYITQEQIAAWNIKTISDNLLDDGLLLWNQTTEQWRALFQKHFLIEYEGEIYYPEHDQTNRIFYLTKE